MLRIDVDRGTVVTTPVGPVRSTAPSFLAVGPSAVVVRPYDYVSGYVVADSGSVSDPPGLLSGGTHMVCSDGRRDRVWLARQSLEQVSYDGSLKAQVGGGVQRPVPVGCDGAGEMLYRRGSDTLVTGDGPPTLVTSNTVIAAGPGTFLVRDCAATAACALTVVDRSSGQRRSVTVDFVGATPLSIPVLAEGRLGSISPDGLTAAVFRAEREVGFVDLVTGISQGVSAVAGEFQSFVWSPNSRYVSGSPATTIVLVRPRHPRLHSTRPTQRPGARQSAELTPPCVCRRHHRSPAIRIESNHRGNAKLHGGPPHQDSCQMVANGHRPIGRKPQTPIDLFS